MLATIDPPAARQPMRYSGNPMNQEVGIQTAPSSAIKAAAQGTYKIPALRVLSEITSSLSSENNLDSLLERFLGTMVKLAGADAGAVRVLTADGLYLRLVGCAWAAARGARTGALHPARMRRLRRSRARAYRTRQHQPESLRRAHRPQLLRQAMPARSGGAVALSGQDAGGVQPVHGFGQPGTGRRIAAVSLDQRTPRHGAGKRPADAGKSAHHA